MPGEAHGHWIVGYALPGGKLEAARGKAALSFYDFKQPINRLGEIRDRSYENQRHRASGLNLLVAAIILWNTTYLQRAVDHLRKQGHHPAPDDLAHLSPLGWEHINLTGDYRWETSLTLDPDQFRPLRTRSPELSVAA